jgi:hypothetical protein
VPEVNLLICLCGKDAGGQIGREVLARLRMLKRPMLNSILKEWNMLFGPEKDFYRLPSRETPRCQGWDRRGVEVILGGLQTMLAAGHMPHVGDGRVRSLKK